MCSSDLRIMIDWTFALLFRPDVVKMSLESEAALLIREAMADPDHFRSSQLAQAAAPPQTADQHS